MFWFGEVLIPRRPTVFKQIILSVLFLAAYATGVYVLNAKFFHFNFKPTSTLYSLLGIVLGLLLVFRTNTAYDRWWEGRKLWGGIVNVCRSSALAMNSYLPQGDVKNRIFFAKMIANYVYAMKEHLREGVHFNELTDAENNEVEQLKKKKHVPNMIMALMLDRVQLLFQEGVINAEQLHFLHSQFARFTDLIGGCERIRKTPIPISYSLHLKRFIAIYMCIIPFGFIHEMGVMMIPTVCIIFYAFVGIEIIGEEIEDPFGTDANDLPIQNICDTISDNVSEILIHPVNEALK